MEVNENRGKTEALLQFNGTGAAKVKNEVSAGSQQIHVEHCLFGKLDIGITQQYTHLGSINAGPHKYDQEVESRTAQANATTKALRRTLFAEKGLLTSAQTNNMESTHVLEIYLPLRNMGNDDC